jgi:hypothetical protein
MTKTYHVRNSQFMKVIRDVHSFFQEWKLKIRNSQPILPDTKVIGSICAALKLSENRVRGKLKEFGSISSPGKKLLSYHDIFLQYNKI